MQSWVRGLTALVLAYPLWLDGQAGPGRGVVRGTVVRDSVGAPVGNAELKLYPAGLTVRSDSLGRFAFRRAGTGRQRLTVRAVGYDPAEALLMLPKEGLDSLEVALSPAVTTLEKVDVRKDAVPWHLAEYEGRRKMGIGRFADSTVLWRNGDPGQWYDRMVERFPGLRLVSPGRAPTARVFATTSRGVSSPRSGAGPCLVRVLIDGLPAFGAESGFVVEQWDGPPIVAAEFYTVAQTPAEFNRLGSRACGVVVLWTQR